MDAEACKGWLDGCRRVYMPEAKWAISLPDVQQQGYLPTQYTAFDKIKFSAPLVSPPKKYAPEEKNPEHASERMVRIVLDMPREGTL